MTRPLGRVSRAAPSFAAASQSFAGMNLPPGEARIALAAKHVFSRLPQVFSSPAPDVFVDQKRERVYVSCGELRADMFGTDTLSGGSALLEEA
jgi:hypothetical protein